MASKVRLFGFICHQFSLIFRATVKRKKEKTREEREEVISKRKVNREPYWRSQNNEEIPDTVPLLFAQMDSLREFHGSVDMPPVLRRYYRKMFVSVKTQKSETLKAHELTEASIGKIAKVSLNHINCSYTNRILKPFIFQDFEVQPLWLEMHNELKGKVSECLPHFPKKIRKKHPINYMYITTEHIPAINALAEAYFWPGIDVSIALGYPEFSCVALYKKLVVGFGMMAPGSHLNEAYISFFFVRPFWRNCGIGTFILYHLISTCISWDITLHATLSNDAILLYNKFTFKVHKMVRNFYDGRLPINTAQPGHAFFMQLEKSVVS